jgi:hypothetical protein
MDYLSKYKSIFHSYHDGGIRERFAWNSGSFIHTCGQASLGRAGVAG